MKIATTTTALAVAAASVMAMAHAQQQQEPTGIDSMLSLLQREFDHSSELLEKMWDSAIGRFQRAQPEAQQQEEEDTTEVRVILLDVTPLQEELSSEEKLLACRVAVQQIEEQVQLAQETAQLMAHLRSSQNQVVTVRLVDETTCESSLSSRPQLVDECQRVISINQQEIEEFLRHGKTVTEICGSLEATAPTPVSCKLCKRFVKMVAEAVEQDMQQVQQVREVLGDLCDAMAVDSKCHTFLKNYDNVVDWIKKDTDPDVVCARLTMCPPSPAPPASEELQVALISTDDTHACFYCVQISTVVGFVSEHAPDQLETLRTAIKYICKLTPKGCKCDETEKQFDKIVEMAKAGKQPQEICKAIGMCKGKGNEKDATLLALIQRPQLVESMAQLLLSLAPSGAKTHMGMDKKCFYCEYFTTLLQVALQEDEQDMMEIRQYADIICGMLGDGNLCHQYVDKLDYVVDALTNGKKPKEICIGLKFCGAKTITPPAILPAATSTALEAKAIVTQEKTMEMAAVKGVDNCFFCTQLAALFKVALAQDEQQIDEIRTIADLVCKTLPKENKCHLVMQEVDQIIDSLNKGETPAAICHDLKFCPTKAAVAWPSLAVVGPTKGGANDCAYCDGAATVLEYALKLKPDQVQQVREAAGIVCDFMPAEDKCHDELKMFDKVSAELKGGKSPHAVCAELKFCPAISEKTHAALTSKLTPSAVAKYQAMASTAATKKSENKSMSMGCLLCEYTAEVVTLVYGNTNEMRLAKKSLETMCFVLPPTAKCDLISNKFDTLAELVGNDKKSPSEACHAIGLCDAAFVVKEEEKETPRKTSSEVVAQQL